jgi:hypothetical protein
MKWLFAALLVLQAHFAASYLVPLDREAQATFGGLLRWAWRIPDRRGLASRNRSTGVYPRRAGSDGVVGTVRLVEGASHGRSYPFATPHGGLLRSHEAGANGPRPRRSVGRHYRSDVGSTHRLKEMRSLRCLGLYSPNLQEDVFSEVRIQAP